MPGLLRWMVSIAAIVSLNVAAVPSASALVIVPAPVKLEAAAPNVVQVKQGGNRQIRRYGGGGRSYSGRSRGSRAYSSRQGGYRANVSGRRSGYNNVRRYSGRYDGRRVNREYVRNVRRHDGRRYDNRRYDNRRYDGRRYDGRYGRNAYRHYDHRHHGKRYKNRHGNYRYYRDGWWYGWPWWLGVGVGVGVYLDAPVYQEYDDGHAAWCLRRYRSYNPATNIWFGYDGRYHACISPYSY